MNPKKLYIACFTITMLIFSLSLYNVISYYSKDNQILESTYSSVESNLISIYVEDGNGDYVLSDYTSFEKTVYFDYNAEKSYCVNESVLSYNTDTSKISVTASGTDNCYVYFDLNSNYTELLSNIILTSDESYLNYQAEIEIQYEEWLENWLEEWDYSQSGMEYEEFLDMMGYTTEVLYEEFLGEMYNDPEFFMYTDEFIYEFFYDRTEFALENGDLDFSTAATTDEGIFYEEDGDVYYFRGAVEDNYVEFAGMLWRIISVDGVGNIKLILFNEDTSAMSYAPIDTGTASFGNIDYNESTAKTVVDEWYYNNLSVDYGKFLEATNYCIDMTKYTGHGYGVEYGDTFDELDSNLKNYGAMYTTVVRLNSFTPSLVCGNENQQYYVGLISADEISLAGGIMEINQNTSYYLYSGFYYATLSPFFTIGSDQAIYYNGSYIINYIGKIVSNPESYILFMGSSGEITYANTTIQLSLLPTITLKSGVIYYTGDGTLSNPYKIVEY